MHACTVLGFAELWETITSGLHLGRSDNVEDPEFLPAGAKPRIPNICSLGVTGVERGGARCPALKGPSSGNNNDNKEDF